MSVITYGLVSDRCGRVTMHCVKQSDTFVLPQHAPSIGARRVEEYDEGYVILISDNLLPNEGDYWLWP